MKLKLQTLLTFILFFNNTQLIFPQSQIDSLIRRLSTTKIDTQRVEILINLLDETMYSDTIRANHFCELMLIESKKTNNLNYRAECYLSSGRFNVEKGNYERAIEDFNISIRIFKQTDYKKNATNIARVLINQGRVYSKYGEMEIALKTFLEAEKLLDQEKDFNKLVNLYSNISSVYFRLHQPEKSKYYTDKTIALSEKITDPMFKAACYITYACSLIEEEKFKEAESYLLKAESLSLKANLPNMLYNTYYNLAYNLYCQKKYVEELPYNLRILKLAEQSGSKSDKSEALFKLGANYMHLNQSQKAQEHFSQALKLSQDIGNKGTEREITETLAFLEYDNKHYKRAFDLMQKNLELSEQLFSRESQEQINKLNAKYQAGKREAAIHQLENEKKIKDLQLAKNKQWIIMLLSIVLLLSVTAIALYINYRHKKTIAQQEALLKEQKILELEKDRQLLATQSVLKGEETERSRLARDLHDGLGGLLLSIKLSLSNTRENMTFTEDGVDQYNKALGLLDTSMKELRRVAHNMMPEALVKFGLKDALADFCSSLNNNNATTKITFQFFGEEKRIDSKFEIGLYRIAQELINNALKYSNATDLMVQVIQEAGRVHLTVHDNGNGFDMQILKTSKGAGIANIKLRVESLNGDFDIFSEPDKGTEASVEFKNFI